LESDISKYQQKIDELSQLIATLDFYQRPSQEIQQILNNLKQEEKHLNILETKWLELSD